MQMSTNDFAREGVIEWEALLDWRIRTVNTGIADSQIIPHIRCDFIQAVQMVLSFIVEHTRTAHTRTHSPRPITH